MAHRKRRRRHTRRSARRNPVSTKALVITGAIVAAVIAGVVIYEKKAAASPQLPGGGGTTPGGRVQWSLNLGNTGQPQRVHVGDTVVVSLPHAPSVVPTIYNDKTQGGVLKLRGVSSSGTNEDFTYDVIAPGVTQLDIGMTVGGVTVLVDPFTAQVTAS